MTISELKKEARIKLSGNWIKAIIITLLYLIITSLLEVITSTIQNEILALCYSILVLIISLPLSYGLTVCMIKIARNEEVSIFDFVTLGLSKTKSVWKVYGRTLLKLILPIILVTIAISILVVNIVLQSYNTFTDPSSFNPTLIILATILLIASLIYLILKSLYYVVTTYVLYDNPNATGKEIVAKSAELMQFKRKDYFLLNLSFIIWYLLIYLIGRISIAYNPIIAVVLTLIGLLILTPYITISIINFYEDISIDNKKINKEEPTNTDEK